MKLHIASGCSFYLYDVVSLHKEVSMWNSYTHVSGCSQLQSVTFNCFYHLSSRHYDKICLPNEVSTFQLYCCARSSLFCQVIRLLKTTKWKESSKFVLNSGKLRRNALKSILATRLVNSSC